MSQRINIYVESNIRGPRRRDGRYMVMLQLVAANGKTAEKWYAAEDKCVTENMIVLDALIDAFKHINKKGLLVHIITECPHFLNSWSNGWVFQWRKNGWMKSPTRMVSNAEKWAELLSFTDDHYITVEDGKIHEFKSWMQRELHRDDFDKKYIKEKQNG